MRRRLVNLLTALSLLLCLAVVTLWLRSRAVADITTIQLRSGRVVSIRSVRGSVSIFVTDGWPPGAFPTVKLRSMPQEKWGQGTGRFFGFDWGRGAGLLGLPNSNWSGTSTSAHVRVPDGFILALPSAVVVAILVSKLRRRLAAVAARRSNLCAACGYDLRATPGRCPECGTVPLAALRLPA